ncbi:MAG: glycosyltransferase family 39 protein [Deltaproteobacteria bacterium]|nr:glycosyltransferase family 39 protein [Deltaproteobacteria bacterium]
MAFAVSGLAIGTLFAFLCGLRGIDFGFHWDEPRLLDQVATACKTHVLLPGTYNYPSLSFDVSLLSAVPEIGTAVASLMAHKSDHISDSLVGQLRTHGFKLRVRSVFLMLTLSTAIWTFLVVIVLDRTPLEALFSALLILSSWEIGYHARWIAPDGLMMSFSALSLLTMIVALRSPRPQWWLCLAAVAVGLATSAKYPGGVLLLGVFYVIFASRDRGIGKMNYLWLPLLTGATFLFVTPGAFVDPLGFLRDVQTVRVHYQLGLHGGYNVASWAQHLHRIIVYLVGVAFSPVLASAVLVFGLSLVGAVAILREEMRVAPLLIALPVIYVLYFSSQRVMIVRNLLIVMPFLAVLAGRGAAAVASLGRPAKYAVFAVLTIVITANNVMLYKFSTTVESRSTIDKRADIIGYLRANLGTPVYLSPAVRATLGKTNLPEGSNLRRRIEDGAKVVYSTNEVWASYRRGDTMNAVNRRGLYTRVSGPIEVNWDYYPNWSGDIRIMAVSAEVARLIHVPDGEANP